MRSLIALLFLCICFISSASACDRHSPDGCTVPSMTTLGTHKGAPSKSLNGVVAPLAAKAREIQTACGSTIFSSVRHTYIRGGGGRISLHASGRAVDMAGNPRCIYAHLHGWPGGYSVDYGRVKHVHISIGGVEDGMRFNHYRGKKTRLARR